MRCKWLSRDESGRPSCEHGPAIAAGKWWRCREKHYQSCLRYDRSEKGRATILKSNASEPQKSSKALYELTRIRIGR